MKKKLTFEIVVFLEVHRSKFIKNRNKKMTTENKFVCVLSEIEHYLERPVALTCGHHACFDCCCSNTVLKPCTICKIPAKASNNQIDVDIESLIKANINILFNSIKDKFKKSLEKFKGMTCKNN